MRSLLGKLRDYLAGLAAIRSKWKGFPFSQYAEDAVINCSLMPKKKGFFVDVGAYHPWQGSNSYRFYLTGWDGITIEPNPDAARAFQCVRPRGKHLVMGVSSRPERLTYYSFDDDKLNSFDKSQAERTGAQIISEQVIDCLPLRDIIAQHAPGQHIDLLSVDCEGLDLDVLESLDWEKTRPSVVVVEDFDQFCTAQTGGSSSIRNFLQAQGYAIFAQTAFSFHYIDTRAIGHETASAGFDFSRTQFYALRDRRGEAPQAS